MSSDIMLLVVDMQSWLCSVIFISSIQVPRVEIRWQLGFKFRTCSFQELCHLFQNFVIKITADLAVICEQARLLELTKMLLQNGVEYLNQQVAHKKNKTKNCFGTILPDNLLDAAIRYGKIILRGGYPISKIMRQIEPYWAITEANRI